VETTLGSVTNSLANGGRDFFDGFVLEISFQVLSQFFMIEVSLGDHLDVAPDDLSVAGREVGDNPSSNPTLIGIRPGARLSTLKALIDESVNRSHVFEISFGSFLSFIPDFGRIADLSLYGGHDLPHVFLGDAVFGRISAGVCFSEVLVDEIADLFARVFAVVEKFLDSLLHGLFFVGFPHGKFNEGYYSSSFSSYLPVETHAIGLDEEKLCRNSLFVVFQSR